MTTIYDDCSKEELLQIVSEMQNDLNLASHEIRILNKQMDKLIAENNDLRLRRKMVAKKPFKSVIWLLLCRHRQYKSRK